MKKFNYKKAKSDGYSDEEIQEYLKNKYSYNFNIVKAKKDGYSDDEIEIYINKRILELTSSKTSSFPPCALDFGTPDKDNRIVYKSKIEDWGSPNIRLFSNGRFGVLDGTKAGRKGSYKCDVDGGLLFELDPVQSTPPATTGVTTPITTTGNDIKNGKLVKFGMSGDIVTEIQNLLIQKGYTNISKTNKPDGIFGIRTLNSVKKFQELNGLKPDGIVGKLTYAKLTDTNAVKNDGSPLKTTTSNQPQIKECTDFPFSFGCKNPKIGEMRKKLIGDNKDVYDQDLYNAVKEDLNVGDKRITQDVYNKIMGK